MLERVRHNACSNVRFSITLDSCAITMHILIEGAESPFVVRGLMSVRIVKA